MEHADASDMGLFKTIDVIVGSPYRSRAWKIVDVVALSALWSATAGSVAIWLDGNAWSTWSIVVRLLVPITTIATLRSWYRHPALSKRARQRQLAMNMEERAPEGHIERPPS